MKQKNAHTKKNTAPARSLSERISALFDERVRPFLAMHGGDAQIMGVDGGMVRVRLYGACQGCGMAAITFKLGVEKMLIEKFPEEVKGLEYE